MPKFGWCRYAEDKFGDRVRFHDTKFRMLSGIVLDQEVRGTIRKRTGDITKAVTYRVRRGNGHYGSVLDKRYQDKYKYTAAMAAIDTGVVPDKTMLATAVDYWKNVLTTGQQVEYNRRAGRQLRMSGYNLFISEALRGIFQMYVDRGDPAAYDFAKEALVIDGAWHDLDLSTIVPKTARAVLLKTRLKSANPGDRVRYRRDGNTNEINTCSCEALRANITQRRMSVVAITSAQVIEYNADDIAWAELDISVRGWWT